MVAASGASMKVIWSMICHLAIFSYDGVNCKSHKYQLKYPGMKTFTRRQNFSVENTDFKKVEEQTSWKNCLRSCLRQGDVCKAIDVNSSNKNTSVVCKYFDKSALTLVSREGSSFYSKEIYCSGVCALNDLCGECKCYDSCDVKKYATYHCDCTHVRPIMGDCKEYFQSGHNVSGLYPINAGVNKTIVTCEMKRYSIINPSNPTCAFVTGYMTGEFLDQTFKIHFSNKNQCYSKCQSGVKTKHGYQLDGANYNGGCYCIFGVYSKSQVSTYTYKWFTGNYTSKWYYGNLKGITSSQIFLPIPEASCNTYCKSQLIQNSMYLKAIVMDTGFTKCTCVYGRIISDQPTNINYKVCRMESLLDQLTPPVQSWMVILRRFRSENGPFWTSQTRDDYIKGFGLTDDYWIGLKWLNSLTSSSYRAMRVDYWLSDGTLFSVKYTKVKVSSEENDFALNYEEYIAEGITHPTQLKQGLPFDFHTKWWQGDFAYLPTASSIGFGFLDLLYGICFYLD